MKTKLTIVILLFLGILFSPPTTFAQDYTKWNLPEGAKARIGKGGINEIAYSPDGTKLAVASSIGIWIYDAQTGQELNLLTGHTNSVNTLTFSPDGNTIASGSYDNTIRLWNADTGTNIRTLSGHTRSVNSVSFSPDGNTIASGSGDNTIRLWNADTGTNIRTLSGHTGWVLSVSFSPDGTTIASGSWDNTIRLWNADTGTNIRTLSEHTDSVYTVSFSPDGNTIASGSWDTTIRLWNADTGTNIRTLSGHTGWGNSVSFSPDGNTIASGSYDNTIRLWNADTGTHIKTLSGHTSEVENVSFSPDGNTIASGSRDTTIRLWNADTGTNIRTLSGHTGLVWSVSFSPDGNTIASGNRDTIRLWNAGTGTNIRTLSGHRNWVYSVSFSPDGNTIASGSNRQIFLWNADTGTQIRTLSGHTGWVESVSFSPDGNTIASGSTDGTIRLWNADTGTNIRTLSGHTYNVNSVSFSPDGTMIASGSEDRTIRLWNADTGTHIKTLSGDTNAVLSVSFSPDGNTIASGNGDHTIRLWNADTGTNIRTLSGHTKGVESVSFSPDGTTIASVSYDNTIRLWNADTGTNIRTLSGHTSWVESVSFSPDGTTIASGSQDGTVLLWDFTPYLDINLPPDTADIPGPTVTILTPSAGQILNHGFPTFTGNYSGVAPVALSLTLDGVEVQAEVSYDEFAYTSPFRLSAGEHTFFVEVTDANGNTAEASVIFTVIVPTDDPDPLPTLQSDEFDGQELQSFWEIQNGDKSPYELIDGKLVVQGGFNQNLWREDTSTRFYQIVEQQKFSVETSLIIDHRDLCSFAGLVIKSPTQNEWVSLKLWGHGVAHSWVRNRNTVYLQFQHRGREIVEFVPGYNPPAGNVPVALRLDRDGENYKAWYKPDAQGDWVHIADTTVALQGPVEVGVFTGICQAEAEGHLTVSFDNFIVSSDDGPTDDRKTVRVIGGRSTDFTDSQGRIWKGAAQTNQDWGGWVDTQPMIAEFRSLTTAAQSRAIAAGYDPELFYSVSWILNPNPLKYQFNTGNGVFDVTYLVSEHWSPNNRGFDIIMEGETVEPLYVTPALHEIDIKVYRGIEVTDGVLDITFHGNSATGVDDLNPMFSALEIIPSSGETPPTVEPEEIEQVLTSNNDPSLILYFSFDELNGNQTIDHSPHQNHGRLVGNPQLIEGRFGNALKFDGVSDAVEVPHDNSLTVSEAVTVMAWIHTPRYNHPHSDWQGILAKGDQHPRSYSFYTERGGKIHLALANGGADTVVLDVDGVPIQHHADNIPSEGTFQLNAWQHVTARIADGERQYWINGEKVGTSTVLTQFPGLGDTASVLIGSTHEGARNFQGLIDEVRIYNRGLSEDEILELMRVGYQEPIDMPEPMLIAEDINKDGVVDILDLDLVSANFLQTGENIADVNGDGIVNIVDLTLVAAAFGQTSMGAPYLFASIPEHISATKIEQWLREARRLNLPDEAFQRGILVLEQLLKMFAPKQTALLPNYPNPFNPETWIPYQLASPADVRITIYEANGKLVRQLDMGHQQIGLYQSRAQAAHWDGRNTLGEVVASGVYYYTLTAGDFTATRKMLILK